MARTRKRGAERVTHPQWSSSWIFVLAASGAAIGLKNIWQFPFLIDTYGGGAFIVVYALCVLLVGVPLFTAEALLGRCGRKSPVNSLRLLAERSGRARHWGLLGWIGVTAGFLILSSLSVLAGWIIAYAVRAATGVLAGLTADGVDSLFRTFVNDPEKQLFWHSLFMLMTVAVVARGVKAGLEPFIKYAVPALFALLIVLLIYAAGAGEFGQAAMRLLHPDFTRVTRMGVIAALGYAFFSLSLGVGAMLTYGAYLPDKASIPKLSLAVVAIDTLAGIVGGLVVIAIVLSGSGEPASRPELLFETLPVTLDQLPWGRVMCTLLFVALLLAAWLSAIALIEPLVAWMVESVRVSRLSATIICGVGAWFLGIVTVLSFNYWRFSFKFFGTLKTLGSFDFLQILTSGFLLPLSGILIALFAGWVLQPELTRAGFNARSPCTYDVWLWSVRVVTPALMLIVLFNVHSLFL
ncbi:MAG: sodium-dependent transporter [Acidiferrobacterales bacterium]